MVFLGGHVKGEGVPSLLCFSDLIPGADKIHSALASIVSHEDKKWILGVIEPEDH